MCSFLAMLGIVFAIIATGPGWISHAAQQVRIFLVQDDEGGWQASIVPDVPPLIGSVPPAAHVPGRHILLERQGVWQYRDLGFQHVHFQWEVTHVFAVAASPGSELERLAPDDLPSEAWDAVALELERDHIQRRGRGNRWGAAPPTASGSAPPFVVWETDLDGWNPRLLQRAAADDLLKITVAASILAALRFAIPLLIRRFPVGCCRQCGYDLTGLAPSGDRGGVLCPECGALSALDKKT